MGSNPVLSYCDFAILTIAQKASCNDCMLYCHIAKKYICKLIFFFS